jgi:hypothetical protein
LDLSEQSERSLNEICIMSSEALYIVFFTIHYNDKIQNHEIDRTYNTYGRKEKCLKNFDRKT